MREAVMACHRLGLATALILVTSCLAQDRGGGDPGAAWPLIGSVLKEAQVSGSLEYWGRCGSGMWRPDFPKMIRPLSESSGSPLEVLQRSFANDPKMRVMQEPGGMIRMVETDVPSDLLDVRISHVSFHLPVSAGMYGPNYALGPIFSTPEVKAFIAAKHIESLISFQPGGGAGIKRVYGELDNVTVSQALDYVLKIFPGFWVYENCPAKDGSSRAVYVAFFESF
jgi:hypothetical protein